MTKRPFWTILTYFDSLIGPKTYKTIPALDKSLQRDVSKLLDMTIRGGFFVHSMGQYSSVNSTFYIKSPHSRGHEEALMVSFLLDVKFRDNLIFKPLLTRFVEDLQAKPDVVNAFHPNEVDEAVHLAAVRRLDEFLTALHAEGTRQYEESLIGQLLILGLDQAGKTSLLNTLRDPEYFSDHQRPTLGVNILRVVINEMDVNIYDVGGQDQFRDRWFTTVTSPAGLIYVHDLAEADPARLEESDAEFQKMVEWVHAVGLTQVPFLLVGNKVDLVTTTPEEQEQHLRSVLDLARVKNTSRIFFMSAKTGENVHEGFKWLVQRLMET